MQENEKQSIQFLELTLVQLWHTRRQCMVVLICEMNQTQYLKSSTRCLLVFFWHLSTCETTRFINTKTIYEKYSKDGKIQIRSLHGNCCAPPPLRLMPPDMGSQNLALLWMPICHAMSEDHVLSQPTLCLWCPVNRLPTALAVFKHGHFLTSRRNSTETC